LLDVDLRRTGKGRTKGHVNTRVPLPDRQAHP
jgi:hypothetical protein